MYFDSSEFNSWKKDNSVTAKVRKKLEGIIHGLFYQKWFLIILSLLGYIIMAPIFILIAIIADILMMPIVIFSSVQFGRKLK